jgi:hypothetical protein
MSKAERIEIAEMEAAMAAAVRRVYPHLTILRKEAKK